MSQMNCPHCHSENIAPTQVPQGVIAVMPCPKCSQLLVRFREKIIALNKEILMNGSKEERTFHLAEVIGEFMEETDLDFDKIVPSLFDESPSLHSLQREDDDEVEIVEVTAEEIEDDPAPISDDEAQRFIDFDLKAIDNMEYFKRHLG